MDKRILCSSDEEVKMNFQERRFHKVVDKRIRKRKKKSQVSDLSDEKLIRFYERLERVMTIKGNGCQTLFEKVCYEMRYRNLKLRGEK